MSVVLALPMTTVFDPAPVVPSPTTDSFVSEAAARAVLAPRQRILCAVVAPLQERLPSPVTLVPVALARAPYPTPVQAPLFPVELQEFPPSAALPFPVPGCDASAPTPTPTLVVSPAGSNRMMLPPIW